MCPALSTPNNEAITAAPCSNSKPTGCGWVPTVGLKGHTGPRLSRTLPLRIGRRSRTLEHRRRERNRMKAMALVTAGAQDVELGGSGGVGRLLVPALGRDDVGLAVAIDVSRAHAVAGPLGPEIVRA